MPTVLVVCDRKSDVEAKTIGLLVKDLLPGQEAHTFHADSVLGSGVFDLVVASAVRREGSCTVADDPGFADVADALVPGGTLALRVSPGVEVTGAGDIVVGPGVRLATPRGMVFLDVVNPHTRFLPLWLVSRGMVFLDVVNRHTRFLPLWLVFVRDPTADVADSGADSDDDARAARRRGGGPGVRRPRVGPR